MDINQLKKDYPGVISRQTTVRERLKGIARVNVNTLTLRPSFVKDYLSEEAMEIYGETFIWTTADGEDRYITFRPEYDVYTMVRREVSIGDIDECIRQNTMTEQQYRQSLDTVDEILTVCEELIQNKIIPRVR